MDKIFDTGCKKNDRQGNNPSLSFLGAYFGAETNMVLPSHQTYTLIVVVGAFGFELPVMFVLLDASTAFFRRSTFCLVVLFVRRQLFYVVLLIFHSEQHKSILVKKDRLRKRWSFTAPPPRPFWGLLSAREL